MVIAKIKFVWDLFYIDPEEIADAENAAEVINQYSGGQQIPIRIIEIAERRKTACIILAGEGALYPWKGGQRVELGMALGVIWHIDYLSMLCERGIDNSPYQDFMLYDTIIPVREGNYFADRDAVAFKGISSFEIYIVLGKILLGICDNENDADSMIRYSFIKINKRHLNRKSNMKHIVRSIERSQDKQWEENWSFECSNLGYELDTEFKDKTYFKKMDDSDKISLVRKMENFIEERGVSIIFLQNFALLYQSCREIDEIEKNKSEVESSVEL